MQFVIKQRMLAVRDSFFITDRQGNRVFEVKGTLLKIPKRFYIKDMNGNVLMVIKHKLWHILAHYDLESPNGEVIGKVAAKWSWLKSKFNIETVQFGDMHLEGSVFSYSYSIRTDDDKIISVVDKNLLAIRDSYVLDVQDPHFTLYALALAIIFDSCAHGSKRNKIWG